MLVSFPSFFGIDLLINFFCIFFFVFTRVTMVLTVIKNDTEQKNGKLMNLFVARDGEGKILRSTTFDPPNYIEQLKVLFH